MRSLFSRLVGSVAVLAAVLVLNFFLFRIMPGDPVSSIVDPRFSPEAKRELASQWGLDRPTGEQFVRYVEQMLTFRFGLSMSTGRPVIPAPHPTQNESPPPCDAA